MIKKLILWLVLLTLCLLGVVSYVGYRSFNTEAFKNQIVQSVQEVTGRVFSVNGSYKLTWDPLPTMTLEDVTLSNVSGSPNEQMFKAEKVQIQIEWASLFTSPSRIKNIIVVKPEVLVERISRYTNNVQFPVLLTARNELEFESSFDEQPNQTQIENIQVENGTLKYVNHIEKTTRVFKDINGTITMGALSGPFSFEGEASYQDIPLKVKTSLGTHEISQPVDFMADINIPQAKSNIKIDAQFHPENTDIILIGSASFEINKPNTLLGKIGQPLLPEKYNESAVGNMKIELGVAKTTLSDVVLQIGSGDDAFSLSGGFTEGVNLQPGQLSLTIVNLNLDTWLDTLKEIFNKTPFPTNPLNFDITVPQLVWHNQTATTLKLDGSIENNYIFLDGTQSSILLPGTTTVQMSGRLEKDEDGLSVFANVDLQSQNLAAALPFFNPPQNKLVQTLQKIQQTEFKSAIAWTPDSLNLEFPALSINNATGVAHFVQQPNEPTDIVLELSNIDLNHYWPTNSEKAQPLTEAINDLFTKIQACPIPSHTTHLELALSNAKWQNTDFKNLAVTADINQKTANIEAMAVTQNQDSLVLKTDIQNLGTPDWILAQNKFEIKAASLPEVLQNLNIAWDNTFVQNARQFEMIGEISGNVKNWQIETTAKTQSITLDLMGQVTDGKPNNLDARFQHKSIPHLFVEIWEKNPLQNLGGELALEATLSQQDHLLNLTDFIIKAGTEHAEGEAIYNLNTKEWTLNLNANTIDLQKVLPDMGHFYLNATGFDSHSFDFSFLNNFKGSLDLKANELFYQTTHLRNAVLQTHVADSTLYIDNLTTTGDGASPSTLQIQGTINWLKTPGFNFKIATQSLPLTTPFTMFEGVGLTGGHLTSEWNLAATGETPLQMVRSLKGNGQIYLEDPTWIGSDLTALLNTLKKAPKQENSQDLVTTRLKHPLTNGSTTLDFIRGNFTIVDGLWQIAAATIETDVAKTESAGIDWDIPTATIQAKVPLHLNDYETYPSIVLKFLKDQKGVTYTSDTTAFISALYEEINQQKALQKQAEEKAKQEAMEKALEYARQEAFTTFRELEEQVDFWSDQLRASPDIETQKEVVNAQVFLDQLAPIIQAPDLTQEQYQNITGQLRKVLAALDKAQVSFTSMQKTIFQQQGETLLSQAKDLIAQINDLYQKRPTLTLMADLLQNSEEQEAIIQRALDQYKRPVNFMQLKKIGNIIQEAYDKINKAYDYAEALYSGRQSVPTNSTIRRKEP